MDDCSLGCQRLIRASPTSSFPSLVGGKETKFRMSAVVFLMMLLIVGRV